MSDKTPIPEAEDGQTTLLHSASAFELATAAATARINLARVLDFHGPNSDPEMASRQKQAFNLVDDFLGGVIDTFAPGAF